MAKARRRNGKPARMREPASRPERAPEASALTMTAPPVRSRMGADGAASLPAGAAGGMFVVDISEELEVTGRFLCRVPMANNVLYCACGGVMSERFNESLFCRTCGREGSY